MEILSLILNPQIKLNDKDNLAHNFKLPIEYIENKIALSDNIKNDLELLEFKGNDEEEKEEEKDREGKENLYYALFNPTNNYERKIMNKWATYYTNDRAFLGDTQTLLKTYSSLNPCSSSLKTNDDSLLLDCESIFYDNGFIDTYEYINLPFLENYNNNELVMEVLSVYNLSSPLFSLLIPIISLILPFFIIKMQGHNISFSLYFEHLKRIFSNHVIGQLFTNFEGSSATTKIYLLASIGFYVFQIYNNVVSCIRYFKNLEFVHKILLDVKAYIDDSLTRFDRLLAYTRSLASYEAFNKSLDYNKAILNDYKQQLMKISEFKFSLKKFTELGFLMKSFYKLNGDEKVIQALYFAFDCRGYIKNLETIQGHVKAGNMNYCKFF